MHRLVSVVGIADHAFGVEAVHHAEIVALPSAAVVELTVCMRLRAMAVPLCELVFHHFACARHKILGSGIEGLAFLFLPTQVNSSPSLTFPLCFR
jgi:hypothetical protein